MLPMDRLRELLTQCLTIHDHVRGWPDR
jgi:hypothetical protein